VDDGGAASVRTQVVRGGSVAWHDLDPAGTYTAYLSDTVADRAAAVPGLRAGAAPVAVDLVPAKSIRVVVQWPEGATGRSVTASRGAATLGYGSAQEDGTWLVKCLPDGEYVVHAACMVPGRRPPPGAFAAAVAGGEVSIQVR
jgi:hypothetical protein